MEQVRLEEIRRQTLKAFQHITPEEHEKQLNEFFAMQERQAEEEDRKELRDMAAEYAQTIENRQQQQEIVTAIIADSAKKEGAGTNGTTSDEPPCPGVPSRHSPTYFDDPEIELANRIAEEERI
eukprot:1296654-Pyramimonas_sp.AAC.1